MPLFLTEVASAVEFRARLPQIFAFLAVLVCGAALFFVFPYSYGYGLTRISIATMVWYLWEEFGDWEHGMLVIPIIAFLVWRMRKELFAIPSKGSNVGIPIVAFSLVCYWLGYLTDIQYAGFVAAQFFIAGLIIWFLGWQYFRKLLFPWLFLMFAWPFLFLNDMVAYPLRSVMAELSFRVLNLIGVDAVRNGSAILSAPVPAEGLLAGERFQVDIADPCSGIRSLFALTMLAALYGYFVFKKPWQIIALVISAFPLAVIGNLFRILLLTFGVLWFGSDLAIGEEDNPSTYHMLAGFAVFGVALIGMVGVAKLLKKIRIGAGPAEKIKPVTRRNPASIEI